MDIPEAICFAGVALHHAILIKKVTEPEIYKPQFNLPVTLPCSSILTPFSEGTFRYLDVLRSYGGPGDGIARHFPPLHNETEEDREMFIAFLSRMLKWRPEDRSNAANLLEDPFLKISMGTPNGKEALKGKERKPRSWLSTEKI